METWVLTAEGLDYADRGTWTTHSVLGVFINEQVAREFAQPHIEDDENIIILTYCRDGKPISRERL